MTNAFQISQMVKAYPGFQLGPLDLALEPGKIMGYVGVNGAGKTTTIVLSGGIGAPGCRGGEDCRPPQ